MCSISSCNRASSFCETEANVCIAFSAVVLVAAVSAAYLHYLVLLFSALFFSAIMSGAGAGPGAGAAPSAVDARPTAIVSSSKAAGSPSPRRSQARGLPGLAVLKKYTKGRLPTLLNGNLEFRVHKKYPGSGPVMVLHNERAA